MWARVQRGVVHCVEGANQEVRAQERKHPPVAYRVPPAELIRIEATLCGRFYPGFKEARHGSESVF
jgi:hypothetical protein